MNASVTLSVVFFWGVFEKLCVLLHELYYLGLGLGIGLELGLGIRLGLGLELGLRLMFNRALSVQHCMKYEPVLKGELYVPPCYQNVT